MISVCMATYNGERYVEEQLDSILSNIGPSDEVVVSDDGSKDRTVEILSAYSRQDCRIKVVDGPHRGVISNFSNAIALSRGDLIFLSDQDDVWRSNKVSRVLSVFDSTGCDLVVHNARIIDGEGGETGDTLFELRKSKPGFLKNMARNSYVGCCMAFERKLVPAILPIPENVEMHDWWIGMIAEKRFTPVFIEDELIRYRRHDGNVSAMHHHPARKMIRNRATLLVEVSKRVGSCGAVAR